MGETRVAATVVLTYTDSATISLALSRISLHALKEMARTSERASFRQMPDVRARRESKERAMSKQPKHELPKHGQIKTATWTFAHAKQHLNAMTQHTNVAADYGTWDRSTSHSQSSRTSPGTSQHSCNRRPQNNGHHGPRRRQQSVLPENGDRSLTAWPPASGGDPPVRVADAKGREPPAASVRLTSAQPAIHDSC